DASGRVRFRAMSAEKGVSPGTVTLDPRVDEKPTPRPAAPAPTPPQPEETELLVPDPIEPTVIVERHVKGDAPGDTEKSDKPKPE
ncbi:MAG: hypothetical protein JNK01_02510, partial [Devosia sp.]|nr:hypothetical protein [Devosia sp.]